MDSPFFADNVIVIGYEAFSGENLQRFKEMEDMISRKISFAWLTAVFFIFISASGAYADHQWSSYHWEKKGTSILTLSIGDNHTNVEDTFWSNLLGFVGSNWDNQVYGGFGGAYLAVNIVAGGEGDIESYDDDYGNTGWLGLASIWITRGKNKHIVRGQSKVNEYYIDLADYDRFSETVNWVHVLCQEIGHTFGLDHNRDAGDTCMNDQTALLEHPTPNSHDTEMLDSMYAEDHGDGGGSSGKKCHPIRGCGQSRVHAFWAEQYDDEQALLEASDAVVEATVLSSSFSHMVGGPDRAVPITRVILKVAETIKGKASRVIVLQQTRGPGLEIEDDPGYVAGDAYTLYLRQVGVNSYRVVNPDGRIRH